MGTPIKEDHVNYMLMYDMLTGIRISVSRCNAKENRPLTSGDFTAAHKLAFDITGNELTPSSKYDFKFKDYAPFVFRKLRTLFRLDAEDYLLSLTGKYVLSELGSPGKSGSFFYYSQDYRFIIKTIHRTEHETLLNILKGYYEHVLANPYTLLCRIYGVHRVKLPAGRKIHFVVMGNILPPNKDVHEVFDLKGSTVGRYTDESKLKSGKRVVLKDQNWVKQKKNFELSPEKARLLVKQLESDVEILKKMRIMDYSLLVGWHNLRLGNTQNLRDLTLSVFEPQLATGPLNSPLADGGNSGQLISNATSSMPPAPAVEFEPRKPPSKRSSRLSALRILIAESDPVQLGPSTSKLPEQPLEERKYCPFYQDDGGFYSNRLEETDQPTGIYFLGIIDIFTRYDLKKRLEHFFRSFVYNRKKISAVDAGWYGDRFINFIKKSLRDPLVLNRESPTVVVDRAVAEAQLNEVSAI